MVNLTPGNISDSAGAQTILDAIRKRWPWVKYLFADGAYGRTELMGKAAFLDFTLEAIAVGHPNSGIDELLPWNFKPAST